MADSFTMKPRRREVVLRVCGVIDLCASAVAFILGLAVIAVGTWQGVVAVMGSVLALWTGTIMTWGRVYASPERVLVMSPRPRRAVSSDIAAIDVCRSDFGQIKRVVPIVQLKHGASFNLAPLALSSGQRMAPEFREQRQEMLVRQQSLVGEIRSRLGVGGLDYSGD